MVRVLWFVLFIFIFAPFSEAAVINYEIKNDKIDFTLAFTKGYSNFDMLKSGNNLIFSFESTEDVDFKRQDFFDMPIKSAYVMSESFRKKFIVSFDKDIVDPVVTKGDKKVSIVFSFPYGSIGTAKVDDLLNATNESAAKPPLPSYGAYFRMVFGLSIVLLIIFIIYRGLKSYAKKQVFTDIPGSGRLLGKVDFDMRKSLYFYEIGDSVYVIGATEASMTLIDKITDDVEATKIRAGLTRKREFKGYMSFFSRKNELDEEMSVNNAIVEDKIKNLKNKQV